MTTHLIQKNASYQALIQATLNKINLGFTISADGKALCFNDSPVLANCTSVFDGKHFNQDGSTLMRIPYHYEDNVVEHLVNNLTASLCMIEESTVSDFMATLSETDTAEMLKALGGYTKITERFLDIIENKLLYAIRNSVLINTDIKLIQTWIEKAIDQDFLETIQAGLQGNRILSYQQYFLIAGAKEHLTAFFAKYPHMKPMLRTIWEAHQADPSLQIFDSFKSVTDIENGKFFVEKYNQTYSFYNYDNRSQKFLADAESWQWLLTKDTKTINMLMKMYNVNDGVKKTYAYHSFGRFRENLSMLAKLNLDEKLAHAILKDNVSESLEYDRFAIYVNHDKETLLKPEFHSGEKYIKEMKFVLSYMDHKNMSLDDRIKFIKTFSTSSLNVEVWYKKVHKKSELSEFEIVDQWIIEKFSKLKKVLKSTYIPEGSQLKASA